MNILTTIGYLGPKGTFTKIAVDTAFNDEKKVSFNTIPECIDAVAGNDIDIAVVPIENAIEGTVQLTVDYLIHEVTLPVVGEIVVPIQQHLLVHSDFSGELSDIEEVHSHSHAIAQCHQYIHKQLNSPEMKFTTSTGRAAEIVAQINRPIAAIGNVLAAEEYGLHILEHNIHDYPNNHTRFIVLTENKDLVKIQQPVQSEKTTLKITLPSDQAGALYQILSAFAWRKMNLSKIESRPTKTGLGNYFFIIDVNQTYDDVLFPGVKAELEALGCKVNILGTYPVFHMNI